MPDLTNDPARRKLIIEIGMQAGEQAIQTLLRHNELQRDPFDKLVSMLISIAYLKHRLETVEAGLMTILPPPLAEILTALTEAAERAAKEKGKPNGS